MRYDKRLKPSCSSTNPHAKALRDGLFKQRIVQPKKGRGAYKRKGREHPTLPAFSPSWQRDYPSTDGVGICPSVWTGVHQFMHIPYPSVREWSTRFLIAACRQRVPHLHLTGLARHFKTTFAPDYIYLLWCYRWVAMHDSEHVSFVVEVSRVAADR